MPKKIKSRKRQQSKRISRKEQLRRLRISQSLKRFYAERKERTRREKISRSLKRFHAERKRKEQVRREKISRALKLYWKKRKEAEKLKRKIQVFYPEGGPHPAFLGQRDPDAKEIFQMFKEKKIRVYLEARYFEEGVPINLDPGTFEIFVPSDLGEFVRAWNDEVRAYLEFISGDESPSDLSVWFTKIELIA